MERLDAKDRVLQTADGLIVRDGGHILSTVIGGIFLVVLSCAGVSVGAGAYFWGVLATLGGTLGCVVFSRREIVVTPGRLQIVHRLSSMAWRSAVATGPVQIRARRGNGTAWRAIVAGDREVLYLAPSGWTLDTLAAKMNETLADATRPAAPPDASR